MLFFNKNIVHNVPPGGGGEQNPKAKENQECSIMVAKKMPGDPYVPPPTDPGDGVNRPRFNFFRNGHVAYQIKGNHEMQQHGSKYFACRPPPPPISEGIVFPDYFI